MVSFSMWWCVEISTESSFDSRCRFHQSNVSLVTAPDGYPPWLAPRRPTGGGKSLRSLIIRKRMFPTANVYRSHVPSTACGILSACTFE